jgi:hypothetical protein
MICSPDGNALHQFALETRFCMVMWFFSSLFYFIFLPHGFRKRWRRRQVAKRLPSSLDAEVSCVSLSILRSLILITCTAPPPPHHTHSLILGRISKAWGRKRRWGENILKLPTAVPNTSEEYMAFHFKEGQASLIFPVATAPCRCCKGTRVLRKWAALV